jgi:hypothetical protein
MITLDVWGSDREDALGQAFKWLARNMMAPRFGSRPIGWYQQHAVAALEELDRRLANRNVNSRLAFVRVKGGCVQYITPGMLAWEPLGISCSEVYQIADKASRG